MLFLFVVLGGGLSNLVSLFQDHEDITTDFLIKRKIPFAWTEINALKSQQHRNAVEITEITNVGAQKLGDSFKQKLFFIKLN